jgi:exopolysaccharide production protein ExoZ
VQSTETAVITTTFGQVAAESQRRRPTLFVIQSLRGIAALLVVLFHLGEQSQVHLGRNFIYGLFGMGKSGVDFFFLLSGFIICHIHYDDFGRPSQFRSYVIKRVVRVYPLYLILTLIALACYVAGFGHTSKLSAQVVARSFLLLPQPAHTYPIINVAWTLSYEVFFYAVFAFGIIAGRKRLILLAGAVLLGSVANAVFTLPFAEITWIDFIFSKFNLEFAGGCIIAYLVRKRAVRASQAVAALTLGLGTFILSWVLFYRSGSENPSIFFGAPYALIVLGAAALDLRRSVRVPWMLTRLGDATYSIYLTHFILLIGLLTVSKRLALVSVLGYPAAITMMLIATLLTGYLVYAVLEKPLLAGLRNKLL